MRNVAPMPAAIALQRAQMPLSPPPPRPLPPPLPTHQQSTDPPSRRSMVMSIYTQSCWDLISQGRREMGLPILVSEAKIQPLRVSFNLHFPPKFSMETSPWSVVSASTLHFIRAMKKNEFQAMSADNLARKLVDEK